MSGTPRGSWGRTWRIDSSTNGTSRAGTSGGSASICASVRIGSRTTGPGSNFSSTPIPCSGVMMSLKRIAASSSKRRSGCRVTSAASSGVRVSVSKSTLARTARYSGR
jgi:hypothetical protein